MSDLVVLAFDDDVTAYEMRASLARMQKSYLIEMEDIVIVHKDDKGKVKLDQWVDVATRGAVDGGFLGLLVGILFLNPLLGAAIGAGAGALGGATNDLGINDNFMKSVGQTLKPGTSALFVLLRKITADKLLEALKEFEGRATVLQSSLSQAKEDQLRASLEGSKGE
jgi:uncharacterized membrane protein